MGPQRAMSIPEKHYMYDHKAMGDKQPKDGVTSLRSKVAQLKHVFQGEGDASGSPRHNVSSPSPRSPDHALLKMRSKSLSDQPARRTELIDPTGMEPQKYFEATNHVERFRYTRAIFAQMEEKSRLEQDKARIFQQHHNRALSPDQGERKRASSDASVMDDVNGQRSNRTGGALMDGRKHLGSMDSLDVDDNGGSRGCRQQAKLLHEMSHSEGDLSRDLSRDLSHERSHDVQPAGSPWASKRAMMSSQAQPVERQVQHSNMRAPSSGERTSSSEHSLPPSYSQHIREKRAAAAAAAAAAASVSKVTSTAVVTMANSNKQPELPQYPDSVAVDTATVATVTSSGHSKRDAKPELPPYPSRSVTSSSVVRLGSTSSPTRTTQDVGGDDRPQVVMRRSQVNRENRDAYGLILLPKRRSRDDARLSKEEIEASLSQADRYWRESADSTGATDAVATMMDSTHSSGSGEEMAHSDSGHNLSHSPTDHDAAQKAWAAMYALNQDSDTECREGEPTSLDQAGDRASHRLSMDSNVEEVIALSSPAVPKDEVLEEPFRHHNRSPSPQHIAMERHSADEAALDLARQEEEEESRSRSSVTKTTLEDWITQGDSSNTDMSSSMVAKDEEETSTDL